MKNISYRKLVANIFGTLGYLACLLLWAWTAILYLPFLMKNEQLKQFILPPVTEEVVSPVATSAPTALTLFFALVTTIVVLVVAVVVLIRIPITIAQTGKAITTKAADSAVPLIARGKQLPKKERRKLTARLIIAIKLLLVTLPTITLLFSASIEFTLSFDLVMIVTKFLAATAVSWFGLQYLTARFLKVSFDKLV